MRLAAEAARTGGILEVPGARRWKLGTLSGGANFKFPQWPCPKGPVPVRRHLLLVLGSLAELLALSVPPRQPQFSSAVSASASDSAALRTVPESPPCTPTITNSWNSQGAPNHRGTLIWFSGELKDDDVPENGALVSFTHGYISFYSGGIYHRLPLPNARITFSSNASCTSAIFDPHTNSWVTTAPIRHGAIFITGLVWPVPSGNPSSGATHVNFTGTFRGEANPSGVSVLMRWNAATYSSVPTEENAFQISPISCRQGSSVGPATVDTARSSWRRVVVGGGGSELSFVGSWRDSVDATICP